MLAYENHFEKLLVIFNYGIIYINILFLNNLFPLKFLFIKLFLKIFLLLIKCN